jgi:hypothetical protein
MKYNINTQTNKAKTVISFGSLAILILLMLAFAIFNSNIIAGVIMLYIVIFLPVLWFRVILTDDIEGRGD